MMTKTGLVLLFAFLLVFPVSSLPMDAEAGHARLEMDKRDAGNEAWTRLLKRYEENCGTEYCTSKIGCPGRCVCKEYNYNGEITRRCRA
uniref:Augerpeptide Hhe9a n=1 Tax=Hastula hectica TaxID=745793 RepID=TE9A_HASHE|nr:RecName: Full=Augerpeptide Hhe9a; AltName: Full=Hhe9.1; Flags: Precursor [Hastula hectica]